MTNGYAERRATLVGSEIVAMPLSGSPRLLVISERAAALAALYGRGAILRAGGGCRWRFRWDCILGSISGVRMRLRLGGTEVVLGIEDLAPFAGAADAARPELPAALRAAYLNGVGAPFWEELEALTQLAVEVLDVSPDSDMMVSPECLGFKLGRDSSGPATRGFLRLVDPVPEHNAELLRVLVEVSQETSDALPLPTHFHLRWAAVAGTTRLPTAEACALEEQDVVLIENASRIANSVECWLGVGPARRFAGRMTMSRGQLQLVEFGTGGTKNMTRIDSDTTTLEEAGFGEIPVSLRFELAQWNASLSEMASLAPGAVIDLGQRVDEHAVSVWVEQRCIGKGQLVALGERLGVRLLSVFASQSPGKSQHTGTDSTDQKGM